MAMALMILVAINRRPAYSLRPVQPYVALGIVLLAYYAIVSALSPHEAGAADWIQRWVRLGMLFVFITVVTTGRAHLRSILRGFAIGLVANAALFYVGLVPHTYQDFLTGWAGDKNSAALLYAVSGLLLAATQRTGALRAVTISIFLVLTLLTGSRTTLAAVLAALLWYLFFTKRGFLLRAAGAALIWFLVTYATENLARIGIYSDRTGSDWFRSEIAFAVERKLAITPPQGSGLGEAFVKIPQGQFFFHDSYATLHVEGGYFALIAVVTATVLIGLRPFRTTTPSLPARYLESATIVILIAATQLGEVFLTVAWALVIAAALQLTLRQSAESTLVSPMSSIQPVTL